MVYSAYALVGSVPMLPALYVTGEHRTKKRVLCFGLGLTLTLTTLFLKKGPVFPGMYCDRGT